MGSLSLCDGVVRGLNQGVRGVGVLVWCTGIITNLASDKDFNESRICFPNEFILIYLPRHGERPRSRVLIRKLPAQASRVT